MSSCMRARVLALFYVNIDLYRYIYIALYVRALKRQDRSRAHTPVQAFARSRTSLSIRARRCV